MTKRVLTQSDPSPLSFRLLLLMAFSCGLTVANLYYNQPLLTELQKHFEVSVEQIGRIPMLTQLGYAFGMLLITPLGDKYNRKSLIVTANLVVCFALFLTAQAANFMVLQAASFLIGLSAIGAQIIIPYVAQLAPREKQGHSVGLVMTGLLLGILLARTLSGFVGSIWGWPAIYYLSALAMLLLSLIMLKKIPPSQASFHGNYLSLLKSMLQLAQAEPVLRQSALIGACLFAGFSGVWATLIFLLNGAPFFLGPKTAGMFGVLGAAGAIAAASVGRLADRRGPLWTLRLALFIALLSFAVLGTSKQNLFGLIFGIFFMDAGIQAAHVSNQARFFRIRPEARSRMNTVYMFCYFIGGALGSWSAALIWPHWGWWGVSALGLGFLSLALLIALGRK